MMSAAHLPDNNDLHRAAGMEPEEDHFKIRPLAEMERAYIEMAIALCNGQVIQAAKHLDVSPSTIYRKKSLWEKEDENKPETAS